MMKTPTNFGTASDVGLPSGACSAAWPADGNLVQVAQHMMQCALSWEPGARLVGNCRACDIAEIAAAFLRLQNVGHRALAFGLNGADGYDAQEASVVGRDLREIIKPNRPR